MSRPWKLGRVRQCEKCPWKKSTNPHDIPRGYSVDRHKALAATIAAPGSLMGLGGSLNVMSCHDSPIGAETHCIGWLANQLGPGNNIGLRIQMLNCENARHIRLDGEQHERFEDTLPEEAR